MFAFLGVAHQHLGEHAGRIGLLSLGGREGDRHLAGAAGGQVDDECQFVGQEVSVQVVQLRGYFLAGVPDDGRAYRETSLQVG